jgi:A/G-specific adenine glycosylase
LAVPATLDVLMPSPPSEHAPGRLLLDWFALHRRDLPWRETYDPYHVWISEIMLQQTQMERGVVYFRRWMERFPDVQSLAQAHEDEVLKLWEGLGYYSRARNLHLAARIVAGEHQGCLPQDLDRLLQLPGIGPYTARAIASIAFGQDVCVIDANVERVMSRLFDISLPVKSRPAQAAIEAHCLRLLPPGEARNFNQSLMEFGSLVCSARTPSCEACPLAPWCQARAAGVQEERPVSAKPPAPIRVAMATGVLVHEGRVLVQKRLADDIWAGLWEFPGGVVEAGETPRQAVIREYLEETGLLVNHPVPIAAFKHSYTRYRVTMHAFHVRLQSDPSCLTLGAAQEQRWARWSEIAELAFPAGHRQLIDHLHDNPEFRSKVLP